MTSENEFPTILRQKDRNQDLVRFLLLMSFEVILRDFEFGMKAKEVVRQIKGLRLHFELIRNDEQLEIPICQGGLVSQKRNLRQMKKDLTQLVQGLVEKS